MAIIRAAERILDGGNSPATLVVNKYKESFDIYIGRGSLWGNPFTVEQYGRAQCIEMYRAYIIKSLETEPGLLDELMKLDGKRLGCFCKPLPCHGDVLVELIEKAKAYEIQRLSGIGSSQ